MRKFRNHTSCECGDSHRLSGGQKQRVALARAMVNSPALILADEPTGSLDSGATGQLLALFADLHGRGQSVLLVTHDPRVATTADRLLSMRDGVIVDETRLGDKPDAPRTRLIELDTW